MQGGGYDESAFAAQEPTGELRRWTSRGGGQLRQPQQHHLSLIDETDDEEEAQPHVPGAVPFNQPGPFGHHDPRTASVNRPGRLGRDPSTGHINRGQSGGSFGFLHPTRLRRDPTEQIRHHHNRSPHLLIDNIVDQEVGAEEARDTFQFRPVPVRQNRFANDPRRHQPHLREPTTVSEVTSPYHPGFLSSFGEADTDRFPLRRVLDVERDHSFMAVTEAVILLDRQRFQELDENSNIRASAIVIRPMAMADEEFFQDLSYSQALDKIVDNMRSSKISFRKANSEVGIVGGAWRGTLRRFIQVRSDQVNRLRYSRGLQLEMHFFTGYESFLLGEVIKALDHIRGGNLGRSLALAFQNRNVSRALVQMLPRIDRLFHLSRQVSNNRCFDGIGKIPLIGSSFAFEATENFPSTAGLARAAILRWFSVLFGQQGQFLVRALSGGLEGLVTIERETPAQNLAAEGNGFESANRSFYGTYIGRFKTNEFRFEHRLPTDESVVRTFVVQPAETIVNNGVEHVLRQLAKHWNNMLFQDNGNFAHQRMEQLDPIETLRFHMPAVLVTLSNLRGRNVWDARVLGPFIKKLQAINLADESVNKMVDLETGRHSVGPRSFNSVHNLLNELDQGILPNVCAGVPSRLRPFQDWVDVIKRALYELEREAAEVKKLIDSVAVGIEVGYNVTKMVNWRTPSDAVLDKAILEYIKKENMGDRKTTQTHGVSTSCISIVINDLLAPRDKRVLMELVAKKMEGSHPAKLLRKRVSNLLKRELRRKAINECIQEFSCGEVVHVLHLREKDWYCLQPKAFLSATETPDHDTLVDSGVFIYQGKNKQRLQFQDVDIENQLLLDPEKIIIRKYVPVAEAISRAQRAYMTLELVHGKRFSYNAFMEVSLELRTQLRRLAILAQVHCSELDKARLSILSEQKSSNHVQVSPGDLVHGKTYYMYDSVSKEYVPFAYNSRDVAQISRKKVALCPPQSVVVVGGGPTGLLAAIHATESALMSGGEVTLYESRDSYEQGGGAFQRAQIVRLDSRQIAMIRYHLGTGYEDVFVPDSGNTDAHVGTTLPSQGFVEITIQHLEDMLLAKVIHLRSKGLMNYYAGAKVTFDFDKEGAELVRAVKKEGKGFNVGDKFYCSFDKNGKPSSELFPWEVQELIFPVALSKSQLVKGETYDIPFRLERKVRSYKLKDVLPQFDWYLFEPLEEGYADLKGTYDRLPSIYAHGVGGLEPDKIKIRCVYYNDNNRHFKKKLDFAKFKEDDYCLDIRESHLVIATGKPKGHNVHFRVTTEEPYGVCCIQGLKISMGMHNFGVRRFHNDFWDDVRSQSDLNTRLVGDFTKSVHNQMIVEKMEEKLCKGRIWPLHFRNLVKDVANVPGSRSDRLVRVLQAKMDAFLVTAKDGLRRKRLQTRYFETGTNWYLGMEFSREYDAWKADTLESLKNDIGSDHPKARDLAVQVGQHLDRLWFESTIEVIGKGDVYNSGGRSKIPKLYLIDSPRGMMLSLGDLDVGDAFVVLNSATNRCILQDLTEKEAKVRIPDGMTIMISKLAKVLDVRGVPKTIGGLSVGEQFELVDVFEVLIQKWSTSVVRTTEGFVSILPNSTSIRRKSNLSRKPDGYSESPVAVGAFPVAHFVCHRTMKVINKATGYIVAFIGDLQASPHFMRYSGLTGACINCMSFNEFITSALAGVDFATRIQRYSFVQNWSNGEVVQRGTGANYGVDGFLRPGFTYQHLLDYLHPKSLEYSECNRDEDDLLSRDWKVKIAASLVPRGMENDADFLQSLYQKLNAAILDKIINELKNWMRCRGMSDIGVEQLVRDRVKELEGQGAAVQNSDADFWDAVAAAPGVDGPLKDALAENAKVADRIEKTLYQTISYSQELRSRYQRISSELFNQPPSVDAIIDDFAVEAQNFANALTQSAAFASGAIAFALFNQDGTGIQATDIIGFVLGLLNIGISFGTMTNVSRYKLRNEESRRIFADKKLLRVMKGVFSLMSRQQREQIALEDNPYVRELRAKVALLRKNIEYYGLGRDVDAIFMNAYATLNESPHSLILVKSFLQFLLSDLIPGMFQENSYVQESAVSICETLTEMLYLQTRENAIMAEADALFQRLLKFQLRLESTIARDGARFGFLLKRKWYQWDLCTFTTYMYDSLCCSSSCGTNPIGSTTTEALGLVKQARYLSDERGGSLLRREIRDLEELYYASRESGIASMMFVSGFIVFVSSILVTVFRIIAWAGLRIEVLLYITNWASIGSLIGAVIAAFHLLRKQRHLMNLSWTLSRFTKKDKTIRRVCAITRTQELLTLTRLSVNLGACVALPWAVVTIQWPSGGDERMDERMPAYIAAGTVAAAIAATVFFFVVEFLIRYRLDPCLGLILCKAFKVQIEQTYAAMNQDQYDRFLTFRTSDDLEKEAWEYTAKEFLHEYRFDTVFAADRFGSIFQHLQSGNVDIVNEQ